MFRTANYAKIFILFALSAGVLLYSKTSYAFSNTDFINIKDLELNTDTVKGGESVTGKFFADNSSLNSVNLDFQISLFRDGKVFEKESYSIENEIPPKESAKEDFAFTIPQNINSGDYTLKVQLFSESGNALTWDEENVKIEGNDFYVKIISSNIVKDWEKFDQRITPEFFPEASLKIEADIYNPMEKAVVFTPRVTVKRLGSEEAAEELLGDPVEVPPRKNGSASINLPPEKKGSYTADLELLYEGQNISSIEALNWNVINKLADISGISTKGGLYYPGKNNIIVIDLEGYIPEGESQSASLNFELRGRNGEVLQLEQKSIEIKRGKMQVEFASNVQADSSTLNVQAVIKKDESKLDIYNGRLDVKVQRLVKEKNNEWGWIIFLVMLLFLALFVAIILRSAGKIRKRTENKLNK